MIDNGTRDGLTRRVGPVPARRAPSRSVVAEDYFRVAMRILADRGPDGLTAAAMCRQVGITKGSFYYHFRTMEQFVKAFTEYREALLVSMLATATAPSDPAVRLSHGITMFLRLPRAAEAAIRAWGRSNAVVAASTRRLDRTALSLTEAVVAGLVEDPERARVITAQLLALVTGLQHVDLTDDLCGPVQVLVTFVESWSGLTARVSESPRGVVVEFR